MASARFRLWYILYRRAKKNHSNKSARWSPFDGQFDCGTVMQQNDNTSGFHGFPWGREYTSFSFRSKVSSSVSSTQSSPMYDALPWELRFTTWSFIDCNPHQINDLKCMKPAEKSDFSQLCLKQTQNRISPQHISCFKGFPLNIHWLQEHLFLLSRWTSHVSKCLIICEWQLYPQGS